MILGTYGLDLGLATIGGVLICIATSFHLLMTGKITGFSSIVFGVTRMEKANWQWKLSLICGMIMTGTIAFLIEEFHKLNGTTPFFDRPEELIGNLRLCGFGIAGFCVGFGTKLGNGCTSGHGVCGLPRFAIRSYVAVACFVGFGIGLATLRYHEPFLEETQYLDHVEDINFDIPMYIMLLLSIIVYIAIIFISGNDFKKLKENVIAHIVGIIFAIGLIFSGMVRRSKVLGFLSINSDWDPSLAFVLAAAVLGNILTFHYIIKIKQKPIMAEKLELATNKVIDWKLVVGECIFGFGWGMGGLCPGPAMILFCFMTYHITLIWFGFLIFGQQCAHYFVQYLNTKKQSPSCLTSFFIQLINLDITKVSNDIEMGKQNNQNEKNGNQQSEYQSTPQESHAVN